MKVSIIGAGYVGMSLAALISKKFEVSIWDIDKKKQDIINSKEFTVYDKGQKNYLKNNKSWNIKAAKNLDESVHKANLLIICTPTNLDQLTGEFDTSSVDETINYISKLEKKPQIVIKSTLPAGHTLKLSRNTGLDIIFSPEFLREGSALHDNEHPSRIIIGLSKKEINPNPFLDLMKSIALNQPKVFTMNSTEAEITKLFSNSFLANRVAFFNEVDGFALANGLSSKNIINGICSDPRIGNTYNNPSFGFGGYCLPKDSMQAIASMKDLPRKILSSINKSNLERKEFICDYLIRMNPKSYGFYRLNMKEESDNLRESASIFLLKKIIEQKRKVYVYEPLINKNTYHGAEVINDLDEFKEKSGLIIANRTG